MLAFTVVELVGLLGLSFYAVGQLLTVLFFLLRPWWVTAATTTSNNGEKNNTTCNSKEYPSIVEVSSLLPAVLVQLPLFNEESLGVRVVESILQQDYNNNKDINNTNNDKNKLYIQILDDSTEARSRNLLTSRLAEWKAKAQERNMEVEYLWRSDRQGYKAGALAAGLTAAPAHIEYVCIFDADYLPDPGVVRSLVQGLLREKEKEKENNNKNRNRKVACLQGRWGYLNPFYNFTTAMQTIILDGHFVVEQWTRSSNLWPLNFNGTAGIWRRDAIEDAGGWSADTLTEDLDLSYRVQLRGWRIIYDPNLVIKGEVPSYISAFITQQIRWARGSMQVAKKILPSVWQSEIRYLCNLFNKGEKKDDDVEEGRLKEGEEKDVLTWQAKLSATYHLTGYFQTVLMLMIQLGFLPKWYFILGMVGPGLTYTISILHQALLGGGRDTKKKEEEEVAGCWWGWCKKIKMNDPLWLRILLLPLIPFFLNGMSLVILVGLVKGLLDTCGCSGEFVRTKKTGDATTTTTETTTKNNNIRGEWRLLLDRGYLYLLDSIPLFRTTVILLQRESLAFLAGGALMLATSFISDWTNLVGCLALAVVFMIYTTNTSLNNNKRLI